MKKTISLLLFLCLISGCIKDDTYIGTIMLTSDTTCVIRVFNTNGNQIFCADYEEGKPPLIVSVQYTGVYIIHAVSSKKTVKNPLPYFGGNIEYFIEF